MSVLRFYGLGLLAMFVLAAYPIPCKAYAADAPRTMTQAEKLKLGTLFGDALEKAMAATAVATKKIPGMSYEVEMAVYGDKVDAHPPVGIEALLSLLTRDFLVDAPKHEMTDAVRDSYYLKLKKTSDDLKLRFHNSTHLNPMDLVDFLLVSMLAESLEGHLVSMHQPAAEAAFSEVKLAFLTRLRQDNGLTPALPLPSDRPTRDNPEGKQTDEAPVKTVETQPGLASSSVVADKPAVPSKSLAQ